jgi:hypothetical protein
MPTLEESYGAFPGGDPRGFRPDKYAATAEELAAWQVACVAAEVGLPGSRDLEPAHRWAGGDGFAAHFARAMFGPGSYLIEVEDEPEPSICAVCSIEFIPGGRYPSCDCGAEFLASGGFRLGLARFLWRQRPGHLYAPLWCAFWSRTLRALGLPPAPAQDPLPDSDIPF